MFEARFQSFDDPQPAQTGPRVQALRAELAQARALRPHRAARRPPSERIRAALRGAARLAHRLHRLGRHHHRARRPRRAVRRWPLHAAGARPGRHGGVHDRADRRHHAGALARAEPAGGRASSATTRGCTPPTAPSASPSACANAGATLSPAEPNPIDAIWTDRPPPPLGPVVLHDLRFAGEAADSKLDKIRAEIASLRADALVVSDPHDVAWTFNIRGSDVAHTPLPLAFAIVPKEGRAGALHRRRASSPTRCAHKLEEIAEVREPGAFIARSQGARRRATHRAARPGDRRRRAGAHHRRRRRQGRRAAPTRSR